MILIGVGSNLGARLENLHQAFARLKVRGFREPRMALIYENEPWLPPKAPIEWQKSFLNTVVLTETDLSPSDCLACLKQIEVDMGRDLNASPWSPRVIDLDILAWDDRVIETKSLQIPHRGFLERPFALVPAASLWPDWIYPVPGTPAFGKSLRDCLEAFNGKMAIAGTHDWTQIWAPYTQLMGVVNITPDSFSDGGELWEPANALAGIRRMIADGVSVLDIGGQSTRPKAHQIGPEAEWARLKPILSSLSLLPERSQVLLSVDTYQAAVAKLAIETFGIDWINDVSGGQEPALIDLAIEHQISLVLMHSLGIPPTQERVLSLEKSVITQVLDWGNQKIEELTRRGILPERLILDPGIGFGKTARQSLTLLQGVEAFQIWRDQGVRLLIGHSRKSFIHPFSQHSAPERDPETLGISLYLLQKKVDFLRVHAVDLHRRAMTAFFAVCGN